MTFSLTGRCARSGAFGVAVTSSSPAVASRCAWARAGVGAVATQNITDPSLGNKGLDLMAGGLSAPAAMERLVAEGPHIEVRQLTIIDGQGRTAYHTGSGVLSTNNAVEGLDCVAAGNLLDNEGVPGAMVAAFEASADQEIGERLMRALEAGETAGGEQGPVHGAGILAVTDLPWPPVDLRMDWVEEDCLAALRQAWTIYAPQMQDYINRALNPAAAPSYGVAGDE